MNLRMAVLLTNNDTSAFATHFPNDGQKVVQLLQPLRPAWTFEVLPVMDGAAQRPAGFCWRRHHRQPSQHIWTPQYHPEMPQVFMQALLGYLADKLDTNTMARAHARRKQPADVPLFRQWMTQFIEQARNSRP